MPFKVVVIGSGAREHALVRALLHGAARSGEAREEVAIPGNAGIAEEARCVPAAGSAEALAAAALREKLDGLAAGKGVVVCDDAAGARRAIDELWMAGSQGPTPPRLLVEERLEGPELSVIALTDGSAVLPLAPARDHKRLEDGDRGPNTGGMGAVSPPRDATKTLLAEVVRTVLEPTVRELAARGTPFRGALYAGLILTAQGPRVLEFNCRLGDPEAQAILLRLRSDPLP